MKIASSILKAKNQKRVSDECCFFMTGWNPNALESSPCPRTKNLDAERRNEERVLFGERRTVQRSTSFFCSFEPATPYPGPRFLQLTTCILELATVLFGERRTVQRSTSFFCSSNPQPPTPILGSYNSQLTTCILQLIFPFDPVTEDDIIVLKHRRC